MRAARLCRAITRPDCGFTLTELVLVVALLGTLAAIAAPRFFGASEFDERFFYEEVRAAVSYARKLAISSGCEVELTIVAAGYQLRQRALCDTGAFSVDVPDPLTGVGSYSGAPPTGVGLASSVSPVIFDALGRARDGGGNVVDFTVNVGTRALDGVGETGYSHPS